MVVTHHKIGYIKKWGFEFLTVFFGVIAAFALNNWNEGRKVNNAELKIISEINNGLKQDIRDIHLNMQGHKDGLRAVSFFQELIDEKQPNQDSLRFYAFYLLRNFISIQNNSGYETLKSKGLEVIENDSLRKEILTLYENDYILLKTLEENYSELQFYQNYHHIFEQIIGPRTRFDPSGNPMELTLPLDLSKVERQQMLMLLWRIRINRTFILNYYSDVEKNIVHLQKKIETELER